MTPMNEPKTAPDGASLRICVDLDGTLCTLENATGNYAAAKPIPGAIEAVNRWYREGAYIIIFTARSMRTAKGDVAKAIERVGEVTRKWLADNGVLHHELIFGKPYAHVYVDDLAVPYAGDWRAVDERVATIRQKVVSDPHRVF